MLFDLQTKNWISKLKNIAENKLESTAWLRIATQIKAKDKTCCSTESCQPAQQWWQRLKMAPNCSTCYTANQTPMLKLLFFFFKHKEHISEAIAAPKSIWDTLQTGLHWNNLFSEMPHTMAQRTAKPQAAKHLRRKKSLPWLPHIGAHTLLLTLKTNTGTTFAIWPKSPIWCRSLSVV